jgi:hypothetical protein
MKERPAALLRVLSQTLGGRRGPQPSLHGPAFSRMQKALNVNHFTVVALGICLEELQLS